MIILHVFIALAAGFLSIAALIAVATFSLSRLAPEWASAGQSSNAYIFVNLIYCFIAAMAGGYITAWIAAGNPLIQALALAMIVLLLGALSAIQQRGKQPIWSALLLVSLTPAGVLIGGWIRLKATGLI